MELTFCQISTVLTLLVVWVVVNPIDCTHRVSRSVSTIYPPQIENVGNGEMIINAGDTLSLTCRGTNSLKWHIHNRTESERITQKEKVEIENNETTYVNVLQITNTTYMDSNYITCFYEGTTDFDYLENATTIYVYAFDPHHLFLPTKGSQFGDPFLVQPIFQHRESVIPCRPSHPDVNVTLVKSNSENHIVTMDSDDITFDPRRGFVLYFPNIFFSGIFECTGVMGKTSKTLRLFLMWHPDTSGPPTPHIDDSGGYIVLNDTFHLSCNANIEAGTLLFMNWTYPNFGDPRIRESEMTARDKVSNNGYKYREVTKNLTVQNAQISDGGFYNCTVTDHTGKKNQRNRIIKVFNNTCHLSLSTDITDVVNVIASKTDKVIFNVWIEAYPPPTVRWLKNNTEIKAGNGEKYITNVTMVNTTLVIKKPRRRDSDNYIMVGEVCDKMKETVFSLQVFEEPSVTLHSDRLLHLRDYRSFITCTGEGNPPPSIEWDWRPCDKLNCQSEYKPVRREEKDIKITEKIQPNDPGIKESKIQFIPRQSGNFRCKAVNKYGEKTAETLIIASEYKDGFAIKALHDDEVVETTTFTLTCGATVFNYSSLYWKWKPNTATSEHDYVSLEGREGFEIITELNGDTHRVTVKMERIHINKSGEYVCFGKRINTDKEDNRSRIVEVKAIVPPEFTSETNLNGSTILVEVDKEFPLRCKVRGTPRPHITWWKDGQRLNDTTKQWLDFNANRTVLIIKRLRIEDQGRYVCQAENLGGNASANLSIEVTGDIRTDFVKTDQENETSWTIYLIIAIVVISLILFVLLGFIVKKVKEERVNRREMEMFSQMLFEHGDPNSYNPDLPLDDQVELLPYDKRWEFPKERLKLGKTLGQGAFGRVVKAEAIGLQDGEASTTVAVKMLKQRADLNQKKALMQELKVMIHLGRHLNVVNLLGAVTKNIKKGELLVIVEYCRYGNLRHFLLRHRDHFINQIDSRTRKINNRINEFHNLDENSASEMKAIEAAANTIYGQNRPLHYADLKFSSYKNSISSGNDSDFTVPTDMSMVTMSTTAPKSSFDSSSGSGGSDYLTSYKGEIKDRPLTTCDLLCYSFQVARGMEYLSSRKLVHRDLAARNILLADDNVVKICDFGLAKDLYKYSNYKRKGDGPLPVKWMALESVRDKVFSSQSDVWSFGIVLWEFFTLGGNPYPGIEIDEEFYKKLKSGYRMDQPEFSTAEVYEIMQSCWLAEAKDRPTFTELVDQLGSQLEASIRKYYVDLNNPYMTMNDTFRNNNDYLTMDTGDDRNYININHVISPPLSPDYINVPSRPRHDSINSDYLSMQSPVLTNFNHTNSPFHGYSNVDKVHPDSDNAIELKPLTLPESPEDPWIPRDLNLTRIPVTPTADQSNYLFMGNRDSNFDKKMGSGSASSDTSSGFHSDYTDSSAPPSYNLVVGQDEYVV